MIHGRATNTDGPSGALRVAFDDPVIGDVDAAPIATTDPPGPDFEVGTETGFGGSGASGAGSRDRLESAGGRTDMPDHPTLGHRIHCRGQGLEHPVGIRRRRQILRLLISKKLLGGSGKLAAISLRDAESSRGERHFLFR